MPALPHWVMNFPFSKRGHPHNRPDTCSPGHRRQCPERPSSSSMATARARPRAGSTYTSASRTRAKTSMCRLTHGRSTPSSSACALKASCCARPQPPSQKRMRWWPKSQSGRARAFASNAAQHQPIVQHLAALGRASGHHVHHPGPALARGEIWFGIVQRAAMMHQSPAGRHWHRHGE
jgi:hypothetical protein